MESRNPEITVLGTSGKSPAPVNADAFTLAAVGIVAYALATILHEGVGHGGACLLSGGKPLMVSTVAMECSIETRLVLAGGTLVNFAAAVLFFVLSRLARRFPTVHFFCWLALTIDLLMGTGYFLFSGIGGFGDWAEFVKGLGPERLLRPGLAIIGGAGYIAAVCFSLIDLRPLIGSHKETRVARAARLMRIPYFTGGVLACIAGAFNPAGWYLVALSAAASTFGGTSGLVWAGYWLRDTRRFPLGSWPEPPAIKRSWPWIIGATAIAIVFVAVIGPGVKFNAFYNKTT